MRNGSVIAPKLRAEALERCLLLGEGENWRSFAKRLEDELAVELVADAEAVPGSLGAAQFASLLLDWPPRGPGVVELFARLRASAPEVALIAATAPAAVGDRVEALEAGVDDCVTYDVQASELMARARAAARRRSLAPSPAYVDEVSVRARTLARLHRLSAREQQTLLLLARGTHLKEIAANVGCGYSTIRTHLRRLCRKLGCSGAREAIVKLFANDAALSCTQTDDCRSGATIR